MGIARRIAELYEVKVNALLDRVEDPREVLDYSYLQQQELLGRIRRQSADVATSRHLAQMRERELQRSADRLQAQSEQAVAAGKEGLARQALAWRATILAHVDDLRAEQVALRADEQQLSASARRLEKKIEAFRRHKETISADYTAAKAAADVGQVVGGVSEEMGDVRLATRRAEDTTARLQARAQALADLLAAHGAAGADAGPGDEQLQAQLDAVSTEAAVEQELARIKDRLAADSAASPRPEGSPPPAGAGPGEDAGAPGRAESGGSS